MTRRARGGAPRVRHLRTRIDGTAAVVAVVLALAASAALVSSIRFVQAGNAVIYRWQPAVIISQQVLSDTVNQETGLRGFALSGTTRFLEPYYTYRAAERSELAQLGILIDGDRLLDARYDAVVASARTWQQDVAEPTIAKIGAGQRLSANDLDVAKARFDELRAASAALARGLEARAAQSQADRRADGYAAAVCIALAALVVLVSGLLLLRGVRRSVLGPVDRLRAQTRVVASGLTHQQIVADGPAELTELGHDVEAMRRRIATQLAQAERDQDELRERTAELARSNDDLQQFAYVASHDLSEPLRKISNFCQLLERQYGPQLDDTARQYIDFAVDGAKRMQTLIGDLLALSRVGRSTERFERVELDEALDAALAALGDRVAAAGGRVERLTQLPVVDGDRTLLTSLLQNLVGNAIKYRRDDVAPVVELAAEYTPDGRSWTISVSDNGIGIDPQYAERIFVVFQRLHLRDRYGGTGIGLALCRKIVDFHGGHIWLADTGSRAGARFEFTLPERGPRAEAANRRID